MSDIHDRLEQLGLSQYAEAFISEGFDSWDTILDITESDLNYLNVKLGHRRKLQRAIAEYRGQPADRALLSDGAKLAHADGSYRSDESGAEQAGKSSARPVSTSSTAVPGSGTKRKYRRHPKPDPNAPERPPSAYVIFSNQVREEIKGQELSFTEIAKIVGERWQVLGAEIRDAFETQANGAKEKYYAELSEYKKTTEYSHYQEYLVEFKAKHNINRVDGKRSRLETESSSSVDVQGQRARGNPTPEQQQFLGTNRSSESSPPHTHMQHSFRRTSASASPAIQSQGLNSPATPVVPSFALRSKDIHHTRQREPPSLQSYHSTSSQSATYSPQSGYRPEWGEHQQPGSGYLPPLSRDTSHGSPAVPNLARQESTLSSDSQTSGSLPPPTIMLPLPASSKSRTLPPLQGMRPILDHNTRSGQDFSAGSRPQDFSAGSRAGDYSSGPPGSRQDFAPRPAEFAGPPPSGSEHDAPRAANWPALLRASEIAREAALRGVEPQDEPPPPG